MPQKLLKILRSWTPEILRILNSNSIGTPGKGLVYHHMRVEDKIGKIEDPFFVTLQKNNRVIGTCCFCHRLTRIDSELHHCYYIRYFSFTEFYRQKAVSPRQKSGKGFLRNEIKALLKGEELAAIPNNKFYFYAYLDPNNLRSRNLCEEFGFAPVRTFSTIIFNRINPKKKSSELTPVKKSEQTEVLNLLQKFYQGYTMFSTENLFNGRDYYVIRDNKGQILVGAQVNPEYWKILEMPGKAGKLLLKLFSSMPFLNKLINKDFKFLTIEGIYVLPGEEKKLELLFESLLAKYSMNSAIMWLDNKIQLYTTIKSLDLGLVNKINKEVQAQVICKFINFSAQEINSFIDKPAYISGIDLT